MTTVTINNINRFCRLCLNKLIGTNRVRISEYDEITKLLQLFLPVNKLTLNEHKYPQQICTKCFTITNSIWEFKKQMLLSYTTLENIFSNKVNEHEITLSKNNKVYETSVDNKSVGQPSNRVIKYCKGYDEVFDEQFNELLPSDTEEMRKKLDDNIEIKCLNDCNKFQTGTIQQTELIVTDDNDQSTLNIQQSYTETIHIEPVIKSINLIESDGSSNNNENDDEDRTQLLIGEPVISDIEITKNKDIKSKEIYHCEKCPSRFKNENNLKAHYCNHKGLVLFQCEYCGKGFNKANFLHIHLLEEHSDKKENIKCTINECGKVFRRLGSLKSHIRKKHFEQKNENVKHSYICEECGKIFKNIASLKEHRYKHADKKLYPYQCDHCDKSYISHRTYKEHILRHKGVKNYECPHCSMKKTTKKELDIHINYHTKERQWSCTQCTSVFNSSANLGMHIRIVHKGQKRFACKYCNQRFGKPDTLKHHEMRHTGEKPHVCEICSKRFIQFVALKAHFKTHNRQGLKRQYNEELYKNVLLKRKEKTKNNEVNEIMEKLEEIPNRISVITSVKSMTQSSRRI